MPQRQLNSWLAIKKKKKSPLTSIAGVNAYCNDIPALIIMQKCHMQILLAMKTLYKIKWIFCAVSTTQC